MQDCIVEVEEPTSIKGPFIFQISDPEGETLLRLSADKLGTAKTWVKTLHAVGLRVRGFRRLTAVSLPGWHPQHDAAAAAGGIQQGLSKSFASFGRAISGRWSSVTLPSNVPATDSIDSELSINRVNIPGQGLHRAELRSGDAAAAAAAVLQDSSSGRQEGALGDALVQRPSVGPPAGAAAAAAGQRVGLGLSGRVMSDDDDIITLEDDDVIQRSHLSRIRQKCKLLKCRLPRRKSRRHTVDIATAATVPASAPGAVGGTTAAAADGSSGSSSAAGSWDGISMAAAAAAAVPGFQRASGSRHRRTLSAPIQKQISWR